MTETSKSQRFLGSLKVHLRLIGIATLFGLTAYGVIHLMIWLFKLVNLM
ncbi:hypothetical protein [Emcibacter nanhaiensis]|nr:hypothetical protein [Emcibacter nanhaiensis]